MAEEQNAQPPIILIGNTVHRCVQHQRAGRESELNHGTHMKMPQQALRREHDSSIPQSMQGNVKRDKEVMQNAEKECDTQRRPARRVQRQHQNTEKKQLRPQGKMEGAHAIEPQEQSQHRNESHSRQPTNMVVHHSATSNEISDYTSAVRNIYLYHTEVNGWSDIGYNYLVAPNGVIYEGRDPAGHDQDVVTGAHFCHNNTGTMGICLLGTFNETMPTDSALNSLKNLLVWKLAKDSLNPVAYHAHPLNPKLPTIAGHRDGCATLCPGDSLYKYLQSIREQVYDELLLCGFQFPEITQITHNENIGLKTFPNPFHQILFVSFPSPVSKIEIQDLSGRVLGKIGTAQASIDFGGLPKGIYIIVFYTEKGIHAKKVAKIGD